MAASSSGSFSLGNTESRNEKVSRSDDQEIEEGDRKLQDVELEARERDQTTVAISDQRRRDAGPRQEDQPPDNWRTAMPAARA